MGALCVLLWRKLLTVPYCLCCLLQTCWPETISKGLSLRGLRRLRSKVVDELLQPGGPFPVEVQNIHQLSINDFVAHWVRRDSVTPGKRRLADVPEVISPEDVGSPMYFISHGEWGVGFRVEDWWGGS